MTGFCSFQQGDEHDQHARDENRTAGQHDTNNYERRAGNQEHGPPARPRAAGKPRDADHREQHAGTEPPSNPPEPCKPRESGEAVWIGSAAGRTPDHQAPAM